MRVKKKRMLNMGFRMFHGMFGACSRGTPRWRDDDDVRTEKHGNERIRAHRSASPLNALHPRRRGAGLGVAADIERVWPPGAGRQRGLWHRTDWKSGRLL